MNTTDISNIRLINVIHQLHKYNITVYLPIIEGTISDFVIDTKLGLKKVQLKTTQFKNKNESITWKTHHQDGYHGTRKKYTKKEIDLFVLYCIETDTTYIVPIDDVKSETFTIRTGTPKNGQTKDVNFSDKYELNPNSVYVKS